MLSELTIGMHVYKRQHMLEEIVRYHLPSGVSIVIADGSDERWEMPDDLKKETKLQYIHSSQSNVTERAILAIRSCKTRFFCFRADRRHISNHGLSCSVEFLKLNDEYSSARGIWFDEEKMSPDYMINFITSDGEIESPYARVEKGLIATDMRYYDVHNTQAANRIANIWEKALSHTRVIPYFEHLQALTTTLSGKSKTLPFFYGISMSNVKRVDNYGSGYQDMLQLFRNRRFSEEIVTIFIEEFQNVLDKKKLSQCIHKSFQNKSRLWEMYQEPRNIYFFKKIQSFFNNLNFGGSAIEDKELEFRLLSYFFYLKKFTYDMVASSFTDKDFQAQHELMELIKKCYLRESLNSIKEVKKGILLRSLFF